jgi:hypothetical protein
MKRGTVTETIFRKRKTRRSGFTVADIINNQDLVPTDTIVFEVVDAYDFGNEAYDGHEDMLITRTREMTDAEQAEYEAAFEEKRAEAKAERYATYLKLRGEFEGSGYEPDLIVNR